MMRLQSLENQPKGGDVSDISAQEGENISAMIDAITPADDTPNMLSRQDPDSADDDIDELLEDNLDESGRQMQF